MTAKVCDTPKQRKQDKKTRENQTTTRCEKKDMKNKQKKSVKTPLIFMTSECSSQKS